MSDEQFPDLRDQLEAGWSWLLSNCAEDVEEHPECAAFESRWWEKLREYERACRASIKAPSRPDPPEKASQTELLL